MKVKKLSKEDHLFLDTVALEVLKVYLNGQRPNDFKQSIQVSRVAYKQALAMLKVKNDQLLEMSKEVNVVNDEL